MDHDLVDRSVARVLSEAFPSVLTKLGFKTTVVEARKLNNEVLVTRLVDQALGVPRSQIVTKVSLEMMVPTHDQVADI